MKAVLLLLGLLWDPSTARLGQQDAIVIENTHLRYTISADGQNLAFVDRATGIDYLKYDAPSACASVRCGGVEYPATSARFADGRLTLEFAGAEAKVFLRVTPRDAYIQLAVDAISGDNVDSIVFLNIPLTLQGRQAEPFGCCALSLNLITRVDQLPAPSSGSLFPGPAPGITPTTPLLRAGPTAVSP